MTIFVCGAIAGFSLGMTFTTYMFLFGPLNKWRNK